MSLHIIIKREGVLCYRRYGEYLNVIAFFILVILLFPLAFNASSQILHKYSSGIIWIAALLANLLGITHLFSEDYQDGSLYEMLLAPYPASITLLVKITVHWLMLLLPLLMLVPILMLLFNLAGYVVWMLVLSLSLGTLSLSLVGAVVALLTLGLQNRGLLLALLILPLYIPILIFASGTVASANSGHSVILPLSLLAALCVLSLVIVPTLGVFAIQANR